MHLGCVHGVDGEDVLMWRAEDTLKWVPSFHLHVGSGDRALVIRSDQHAFSATEPPPQLSELFLINLCF